MSRALQRARRRCPLPDPTCGDSPRSRPRLVHGPRHTAAQSGTRLHIQQDPGLSVSADHGVCVALLRSAPGRIRTCAHGSGGHGAKRAGMTSDLRGSCRALMRQAISLATHSQARLGHPLARRAVEAKGVASGRTIWTHPPAYDADPSAPCFRLSDQPFTDFRRCSCGGSAWVCGCRRTIASPAIKKVPTAWPPFFSKREPAFERPSERVSALQGDYFLARNRELRPKGLGSKSSPC